MKGAESLPLRRVQQPTTFSEGDAEISEFDINDFPLLKGKKMRPKERSLTRVPTPRLRNKDYAHNEWIQCVYDMPDSIAS